MSHLARQLPKVNLDLINASLRSMAGMDQMTVISVYEEELSRDNKFNALILRLHLTYDHSSPNMPHTLIAKLPTVDTELHERAEIFQPGTRENWFYRVVAPRSSILVPRSYYYETDQSTSQSILLLEDLTPFPTGNWFEGATLEQAELALAVLARLHADWWGKEHSPEIQKLMQLLSGSQVGEQNLVQELYDAAWPQFLRQDIVAVSNKAQEFGATIMGHMEVIDRLIEQAPKTLVHGDFRLDNILFGSGAGMPVCWIIDWEDVSYGNGMIDVSWFLGGCLPIEKSHYESALLQYYYQTLISEGVSDYSWEQCYYNYRCSMCSAFIQGILSSTLDDNAAEYDYKLARTIGERFIGAIERLNLLELISSAL